MTPERKAQLLAELDEIVAPFRPQPQPIKPKVVTRDGETIGNAVVKVSPADPNAAHAADGVVRVQRSDWVTINMPRYEAQLEERARERRVRRNLDPYRLGLYGPLDDEDH